MAKKKHKEEKENAERWLLTYADLITLLLILFIVLFAMSNVDKAKYQQLANSLSSALGNGGGNGTLPTGITGDTLIPDQFPDSGKSDNDKVLDSKLEAELLEGVKEQVEEMIKGQKDLIGTVEASIQERGVLISIMAQLLFEPGRAEIEPQSRMLIEKIGNDILKNLPGKNIRVEGHTDSDPLQNSIQYVDNWGLSCARAANVVRILTGSSVGLDRTKISPIGYGEFQPIAPNNTVEGKAKNRRVDIVILREMYSKSDAQSMDELEEEKAAESANSNDSEADSELTEVGIDDEPTDPEAAIE